MILKAASNGVRTCTTLAGVPLLFMTNHGADPSQELQEVASGIVGVEAYHELAMGQGQTQSALDLLQSCARSGMLIANCMNLLNWPQQCLALALVLLSKISLHKVTLL